MIRNLTAFLADLTRYNAGVHHANATYAAEQHALAHADAARRANNAAKAARHRAKRKAAGK